MKLINLLILLFLCLLIIILSIIHSCVYCYVTGLLILLILSIKVTDYFKIKKSGEIFCEFNLIPQLDSFEETKQRISPSKEKYKHAVLLIHGFSASTYELRFLVDQLEKNEIPFYLPTLTGFGINDMHLLANIKPSDWLRDVVNAYDTLSALAEKISVVGHSMGGLLALYLSQIKEVDKVILTAPYLLPKQEHQFYKKILKNKLLNHLFFSINPVINKFKKKSQIDSYSVKRFAISAFPFSSVKALWDIQDIIDYEKLRGKNISIIFGGKDTTVNESKVVSLFEKNKIIFNKVVISGSKHNVLEDSERTKAIEIITDILKK